MCNSKIYTYQSKLSNYLLLFLFFLFFTNKSIAQPVLALTPVITTGLSSPIQFVNAGDGTNRIFIVQQGATIRAYDAAFNFLSVFLTVSNVSVGGERGLLSMVFHPDYKNNGFFYVYYTNTNGDLELARYKISSDPNIADAATKVIVITIPHPTNSNHNGGELHFGSDGFLYLSTGDGGGSGDVPNNAQNTSVLLGKMLRFNVNTSLVAPYYTIPAGNPYSNEIFDLGLRNPYRWSFDKQTNDMWIGDVGQGSFEEIDYRAASSTGGVNYGWRCYEGNATFNPTGCGPATNYLPPVYTYPNTSPSSVVGGIVYRGAAYPILQGYNISCDFYSGIFYKTVSNGAGGWLTSTQTLSTTGIADFGEAEDGEAYVVSLTANTVSRVSASTPLPVTMVSFNGAINNNVVKLNWKTALEENIKQFEIEYSTDGLSFVGVGNVKSNNAATGSAYSFLHSNIKDGTIFYKLKIIEVDGSFKYSNTIRLVFNYAAKSIVSPSVISNGVMNVNLKTFTYKSLELISINGTIILKKDVTAQSGNITIPLGKLTAGIYMVRLIGNQNTVTQKILVE